MTPQERNSRYLPGSDLRFGTEEAIGPSHQASKRRVPTKLRPPVLKAHLWATTAFDLTDAGVTPEAHSILQ